MPISPGLWLSEGVANIFRIVASVVNDFNNFAQMFMTYNMRNLPASTV